MANILQNEYQPDYVSPPGETLLETLDAMGMSQVELAKRMGCPVKTIHEIVQKKAAITTEVALQLVDCQGSSDGRGLAPARGATTFPPITSRLTEH